MKKFLMIALMIISMGFGEVDTISISPFATEVIECKYSQCTATAKSTGNQCKHCVSNSGDKYCWQHD